MNLFDSQWQGLQPKHTHGHYIVYDKQKKWIRNNHVIAPKIKWKKYPIPFVWDNPMPKGGLVGEFK